MMLLALTLILIWWVPGLTAPFSMLPLFSKPKFSNETKNVLRGFAPLQDLRGLELCHVLPFAVMNHKLSQAFLDVQEELKPGDKITKDFIDDLKSDVYKVDNQAAFLKSSDVKAKMSFYHENGNQRRQLEEHLEQIKSDQNPRSKAYIDKVQDVLNLFYNAPANLRVSSDPCLNEGSNDKFEDPSLRSYTESPRESINDAEITDHSRYLLRKYRLDILRNTGGAIRTTDKKKSERNPVLPNFLKEYNKGLNVFQFFSKDKRTKKTVFNKTLNV